VGVWEAIENVVRSGAGRVAATMLGGELRWSSPAWDAHADAAAVTR
jgi:hypothetical protein